MDDIRPGYTRISDVVQRYSGYDTIPKHILDAACQRGTTVHAMISATMSGMGCPDITSDFQGYYDSFESWYNHQDANSFYMPERWYDDETMMTGECDCLMQNEGQTILIDFKTSAKSNKSWILQAGGYTFLSKKCGIIVDKIRFFRLSKKGAEILQTEYDPVEAETLFKKALDLHNFFK